MPYPDPFNFNWAENQSSKPGSDMNSAMDIGQLLTRLTEGQLSQYGPIQTDVLDKLYRVLQGDTTVADRMSAPNAAAIRSQLGHAERNIQDNTPFAQIGDALAQLGSNAMTAIAGVRNQNYSQLFNQAMNLGQNAFSTQVGPWVTAAGQIMKKPASGGGGVSS